MKLSQKQQRFTRAINLLVCYANYAGYELTYGDAYRSPEVKYGHPESCHRNRLAVDFNVFKDGEFLTSKQAKEAHNNLHNAWDFLGGAKRIKKDLNHYSFEHNGIR